MIENCKFKDDFKKDLEFFKSELNKITYGGKFKPKSFGSILGVGYLLSQEELDDDMLKVREAIDNDEKVYVSDFSFFKDETVDCHGDKKPIITANYKLLDEKGNKLAHILLRNNFILNEHAVNLYGVLEGLFKHSKNNPVPLTNYVPQENKWDVTVDFSLGDDGMFLIENVINNGKDILGFKTIRFSRNDIESFDDEFRGVGYLFITDIYGNKRINTLALLRHKFSVHLKSGKSFALPIFDFELFNN